MEKVKCGGYRPVSNYERLQSMSIEDFATWVETIANCDVCPLISDCRAYDGTSHATCRLKWLKWLRSQTKEGIE